MNRAVQNLSAEALFVSDIQPSQNPTRDVVAQTITAMLLCYGREGCVAEFAAQFGDHPDTAARRMSWAQRELNLQPARYSGQDQPMSTRNTRAA